MGAVMYGSDYPDQDVTDASRELAMAFGYPCVCKGRMVEVFPGPRSLTGYVGAELGIPALAVGIGGCGFSDQIEQRWAETNMRGIRNLMRHLGMVDEALERPERTLVYSRTRRVNPRAGGLVVPEWEPDELMREVKAGELLGRVISPYTLEEVERLEAPCDGWLLYFCRTYPVRPGNWAFGVIDAEGAEWVGLSSST
jgi:predicted deacylase